MPEEVVMKGGFELVSSPRSKHAKDTFVTINPKYGTINLNLSVRRALGKAKCALVGYKSETKEIALWLTSTEQKDVSGARPSHINLKHNANIISCKRLFSSHPEIASHIAAVGKTSFPVELKAVDPETGHRSKYF
jgi:hypothetical protein